jgi:hypothetical protein
MRNGFRVEQDLVLAEGTHRVKLIALDQSSSEYGSLTFPPTRSTKANPGGFHPLWAVSIASAVDPRGGPKTTGPHGAKLPANDIRK